MKKVSYAAVLGCAVLLGGVLAQGQVLTGQNAFTD